MTGSRTTAQLYCLVIGVALIAVGVVGFFYESAFTRDTNVRDSVFGAFDVNGWQNLIHLATGAIGLAVVMNAAASRTFSLVLGILYIGLAVWGFVVGNGDSILSIIPVSTGGNILHLTVGLLGLGAYSASGETSPLPRGT